MSRIDTSIASDKRKRKWIVLSSIVLLALVMASYLAWLFLLKGFTVTVHPAEAAQTQRFAVASGSGFFIENKLYMLGPRAEIVISADKFEPLQRLVLSSEQSNLSVTLQPMPASIKLDTVPAVADISWTVNGQLYSQGPMLTGRFAPGEYQISAEQPYFQPQSLTLTAAIADDIAQTLTLTPVQGELTLASRPAGASVTVNGQVVGKTPLILPQNGGSYQVQVNLEGYEPVQDTIDISYRQPKAARDYFLQPLQAVLTIATTPQDGVLLLNGKPASSPASIDAGKAYTVRYEKAGYLAQSQNVTLKPAEQRTLNFELKAEMGQVRFSANHTADVLINGKMVGQTPLTLSLQALAQNVEFRKTGYRTVSRTVTPSQRQTQTVQADMLTEFDARRREGKPLFAQTLGINLIEVQLKAFTMGSPANEADRGRNEHPLNVNFSRNIWVSAHEITEAQYGAFKGQTGGSALPVTQVSWLDAVKFSNWLSVQEGLAAFYNLQGDRVVGINADSPGYRLLTEAEWEFIAKHNRRAARTTYVWGSEDRLRDKQGNFADKSVQGQQTFFFRDYNDGFAGKAPVGSFRADRAGFYDLDGNVREWVHDAYAVTAPDTTRQYTDYRGAASGQGHVIKGASYKSGRLKELRASIRNEGNRPQDDVGFRIARYQ
ncbi:Formylglycine-generating enzyme, required for sulfatase activity, contains SUMF1/FGE domain [Rheinheimera pacifica]|uniref:Formylglycine-generating enzyme, required for sulfatase activity, contains SUMF1/FGE domain n=1 Tax=Rheinheimera pacifica TaxID=173990 RepID=A0A1H6J011_9GAMM|nr:PEGA domain-containing protein [Rheinheimera pacifica]SEH54863.1 Formylglycine-generating enzyme, required for sulfatase activity, contains SUMF1/FGE domain [Rheinheimera pacifica]